MRHLATNERGIFTTCGYYTLHTNEDTLCSAINELSMCRLFVKQQSPMSQKLEKYYTRSHDVAKSERIILKAASRNPPEIHNVL